ncbi:MAG: 50S ribosomal protein L30 [bacterium]|nr:50S ribosomal protein L30 [bacterium]
MSKIRITLKKGLSGRIAKHRKTVSALGLKHVNHQVIKDDHPAVRGMVKKIDYLLTVEEIK